MIQTERLRLVPLTHDQLQQYLRADHSLEETLGLTPIELVIAPELKEAIEQAFLPNTANPEKNYLLCTLWTIILQSENKMVADLCIVDEPNEHGEIEIGYGTYPEHQGKGYMTEAVGGIIQWARQQPGVKAIVAGTDKTNIASYTILQKNGFVQSGETETGFTWRLEIQ
jgi:ribosomal-protein-alanine N-acetyltransferase